MDCRIVGNNYIIITANDPQGETREVSVRGKRLYGVDSPSDRTVVVTVRWPGSNGPATLEATREFARALLVATKMGRGIYREAARS